MAPLPPTLIDPDKLTGCLLGMALGDALGLPYEGLSARRGARLFGPPHRFRLLADWGMVSDDTEHACFVAQALVRSAGEPQLFLASLGRSLRWWLLGLPAGVGLATLRACLRLWLGVSPRRAGVFSAGNGPAMRSPLLGAALGHEPARLTELVTLSTRLTHTDPLALWGGLAVAWAAHCSASDIHRQPEAFFKLLQERLGDSVDPAFLALLEAACRSAADDEPLARFAAALGCRNGISGYMGHTVPGVLQCWLRHGSNFRAAVEEIIAAGGDTDTTAAILGGIIGSGGCQLLPQELVGRLLEWPRSRFWMEELAARLHQTLSTGKPGRPPGYFVPGLLPRNLLFLIIVLLHGLRRLLPPY